MLNEKKKISKGFLHIFDPGEKFLLSILKKKKQIQRKRFFNATFSLLFRCSNTVVTFYTLFNIKTISYWPLQFSHFFCVFFVCMLLLLLLWGTLNVCFLRKLKKKVKSSLKRKKDKKQLWKDTFGEFEETLYEPFGSIVWATFDVLVFLRKLKICGRYMTWKNTKSPLNCLSNLSQKHQVPMVKSLSFSYATKAII